MEGKKQGEEKEKMTFDYTSPVVYFTEYPETSARPHMTVDIWPTLEAQETKPQPLQQPVQEAKPQSLQQCVYKSRLGQWLPIFIFSSHFQLKTNQRKPNVFSKSST